MSASQPDWWKLLNLRHKASELKQPTQPQPLGRTISQRPDDDPKEKLKGSILETLCALLSMCESLPPGLIDCSGFPTVHPGSTPDDIAKANVAASSALVFVAQGLKQHGMQLTVIDHNSAEGRPSQAYFVLHQGENYGITANTICIDEMYYAWLQNDGFAR